MNVADKMRLRRSLLAEARTLAVENSELIIMRGELGTAATNNGFQKWGPECDGLFALSGTVMERNRKRLLEISKELDAV